MVQCSVGGYAPETTWDALLDLQEKSLIKIYTPEDVERLMKEHPKSKVKSSSQTR